jgi:hypothetical protein
MLGIHAEAQRDFYRLVELGELYLLQERHCVRKRVSTLFDGGARLRDVFS